MDGPGAAEPSSEVHMYPLIVTAAVLAFAFLTVAYSPVFDEEFQDALDDYRRFTGSWPRARQTLR